MENTETASTDAPPSKGDTYGAKCPTCQHRPGDEICRTCDGVSNYKPNREQVQRERDK